MQWRDTVIAALKAYSNRHGSRLIGRQQFITEELSQITDATQSIGATPAQTLSRVMQQLRDDGLVEFAQPGQYLLLDTPIDVETEDFSDDAIDLALKANKLRIGQVETDVTVAMTRRRKGQERLRLLITDAYGTKCAVCDIDDSNLLIASHILGWAESPEHRGDLSNVICLCRIHDALFERGYWSLDSQLHIIKRQTVSSQMLTTILGQTVEFRPPMQFLPGQQFLKSHRDRFNLGG